MGLGPISTDKRSRYILKDNNALHHYTHTAEKAEHAAGTRTCVSGAASYDTNGGRTVCGVVISDEATIPYSDGYGFTLTDATTTTCDTLANDSGAPYGSGQAFQGIHAAYSKGLGQSALTKAYNVAGALNGHFVY